MTSTVTFKSHNTASTAGFTVVHRKPSQKEQLEKACQARIQVLQKLEEIDGKIAEEQKKQVDARVMQVEGKQMQAQGAQMQANGAAKMFAALDGFIKVLEGKSAILPKLAGSQQFVPLVDKAISDVKGFKERIEKNDMSAAREFQAKQPELIKLVGDVAAIEKKAALKA